MAKIVNNSYPWAINDDNEITELIKDFRRRLHNEQANSI